MPTKTDLVANIALLTTSVLALVYSVVGAYIVLMQDVRWDRGIVIMCMAVFMYKVPRWVFPITPGLEK